MAEMALEFYTHKESARPDRRLARWAFGRSVLALIVSAFTLCKELGWLS
jgi:hypothetical protein